MEEVAQKFDQFIRKPYLDEYLAQQGKLTFIDQLEKVDQIKIQKRDIPAHFIPENPDLVKEVVDQLVELGTPVE